MVYNLFSKRQRQLRGQVPDVYSFDNLSEELRVQIVHVFKDLFETDWLRRHHSDNRTYAGVVVKQAIDVLRKERGLFNLLSVVARQRVPQLRGSDPPDSEREELFAYFLSEQDVERALDVVEIIMNFSRALMRAHPDYGDEKEFRRHVDVLNTRLREAGVGYAFQSNRIIRVDNEFIHNEAIKPALVLLYDKQFATAEQEYLSAHEHYRHGRHKECLADCLKSFESVMKIIADARGWKYDQKATAKSLIELMLQHDLIPTSLQAQFQALRSCLESGVPTLRNRMAGHGQGTSVVTVPDYLARYMLNLTSSNIVLLAERHRALP